MLYSYDHLETQTWTSEIGPTINSVPSDSFTATLEPGNMLAITNTNSAYMAGGLVTCKPVTPVGSNTLAFPYFGLDLDVYVAPWDLPGIGRLEVDVKRWVTPAPNSSTQIANIANCSSQWNRSTGQWQIDGNPPGWLSTGFKPVLPSSWTTLSFRYQMTSTTFSVLSTSWGPISFEVSVSLQNVPLEVSNWGPSSGFAIQIQTENLVIGTTTVYVSNIKLSLSDQPIP